jgi:predicted esterase
MERKQGDRAEASGTRATRGTLAQRALHYVSALSVLALAACSSPGSAGSGGFPAFTAGAAGAAAGSSAGGGAGTGSAGANAGLAGFAGSAALAGAAGTAGSGGTAGATDVAGAGGLAGSGGIAGTAGIAGTGGLDSASGAGGIAGAGGTGGTGGSGGNAGSGGAGGLAQGRQVARPIGKPFAKNGFWEYLPKGYGDGTKRPLLVFWHGVGENGDGSAGALNIIVQRHGPPMLIATNQWPSTRPFVVLSPQHANPVDRPSPEEVHDFLTFAMTNYDVDPARIYLTGLSSGALGCWGYLGQYKGEQVVAATLIAGNSNIAYQAAGCSLVAQVPLWTFHGTADTEQPIVNDDMGMASFAACPQPRKEVLYTTYPGVSHQDSWTMTYNLSAGHDIYAWLLSKTR